MLIALAAVLCLTGTSMAVGHAEPLPTPQHDPFYTPPLGWDSQAPGTILNSRPVEVASLTPQTQDADAWQLLYRTTDTGGMPMATVTTVLRPRTGQVKGLISYQPATDASAPQCAPSFVLRQGAPDKYDSSLDLIQIEQMLSSGHAISVPDWEGPKGTLFTPRQPGYAVLDGMRAAQDFTPLGLSGTDTPVAAMGYSGGSFGTSWVAQMQPTYAPELRLVGIAMGGWTVPIGPYAATLDGGPFSGFLPSLLPGMLRSDPVLAAAFDKYLTPAGHALMAAGDSKCVTQNVAQHAFLHMDDYLTIPFSQLLEEVRPSFDALNFNPVTSTVPLFLYNAVHDEIVTIAGPDQAVAQWCAEGAPITYTRDQLSEHVSLAITATSAVLRWIDERLSGQPAPQGCSTRTVPTL
ncbi:lipase family protein [Nocardia asteroides]|uniref:Lipase n=1 Tax=Nocardia asteroides NBRC 15531 TaxID=1110697 RepID=U5E5A9_NOCAS|nr:lipase family protein [Nocardia asteroides]UGT46149.1 lipase family protein [Nocardia asteroides]GAD82220.1 putative lipase [Nocardia asteroides NBRC 15531]